jgi:dTDP-4-dehydrorhamnose reductase
VIPSSLAQVLVTGGDGQLARTFGRRLSGAPGVTFAPRSALNVTDAEATRRFIDRLAPRLIVNCAAYNNVDGAEDGPDAALAVNAAGVSNLASAAAELNATFVHYRTDFVFDGVQLEPYDEADVPNPLSKWHVTNR